MVAKSWVAVVLAGLAVTPLLAPEIWSGFRLALTDTALAVLSQTEQPLSVRSPGGPWALGLVGAWFAIGCWRGDLRLWEIVLVLLGGAVALARLGNAWLMALLIVAPLARQLAVVTWRPAFSGVLAIACLTATAATLIASKPPDLTPVARRAVLETSGTGTVLADWRWAPDLQRDAGPTRQVLASHGLAAEAIDFWLDYLRVAQGHERWAALLDQWNVDVLVLDAADQERKAADLVRAAPDWQILYDDPGTLVAQRRRS